MFSAPDALGADILATGLPDNPRRATRAALDILEKMCAGARQRRRVARSRGGRPLWRAALSAGNSRTSCRLLALTCALARGESEYRERRAAASSRKATG